MELLAEPTSERQFIMYEALRKGADVEALYEKTYIKPWFIEQMKELVELEEEILKYKGRMLPGRAADRRPRRTASPTATWPSCWACPRSDIREQRMALGVVEALGAGAGQRRGECRLLLLHLQRAGQGRRSATGKKIMVLGGGPNRIGQGIEFDYCCVHAAFALRDEGYRVDHGQLQPGNRLHRLRHLGQALLRAADGRGCPEHLRKGKARRGHRPVRRPDAAEHRRRAGRGRGQDPRHLARRPSIWPRTGTGSGR